MNSSSFSSSSPLGAEVDHLGGDARLVDHLVGDEDRRVRPQGERDGVRRARVEHLQARRRGEADLGEERSLVDAGHVHPADLRSHRTEQRRDEVVRERARCLLALHRDQDRGRLLRADPDRQHAPGARVVEDGLQQHDVLLRGIECDPEDADLDHDASPSGDRA